MIKKLLILGLLLFLTTACRENSITAVPSLDPTALNETAVWLATVDATQPTEIPPTVTLAPAATWTMVPTIDRTRPSNTTPTTELPCNLAGAGTPIDVTIPDGTVMAPGESFLKTWRLENVGSCTWTRLYAVTFFSGNSLNAYQSHNLMQEVQPGDMIDVTVEMEAPQAAGVYQSNWMLSNAEGEMFGIGPNGDAPFYVLIEVASPATETPQPSLTPTPTPVVYVTGSAEVVDGDQFDLDSAEINPEDAVQADFVYRFSEEGGAILTLMNGADWVVFGEEEPRFNDCTQADLTDEDVVLNDTIIGSYICYRTSDVLPGWIMVESLDDGAFGFSFLTWAVP